jgi:ribonuclease E
VIVSEATAVVDDERKLRALVASKPRTKAFKVELNAHVAELLIGPGAARLQEIEASTRRRFFLVGKNGVSHEHFEVLAEGTVEKLAPVDAPVAEGQVVELKLVEVGRHDARAAVGKIDGIAVSVGGAARLVGKKVSAHVERVLDGVAYATLAGVEAESAAAGPITAEAQAEKPTRASRAKKPEAPSTEPEAEAVEAGEAEAEPEAEGEAAEEGGPAEAAPKKKTRRGSRGGRSRKRKPAAAADAAPGTEATEATAAEEPAGEETASDPTADSPPKKKTRRGSRGGRGRKRPAAATETNGHADTEAPEVTTPTIHVPEADLGEADVSGNGDQPTPRKKTRRGSRGGRRRRKPATTTEGAPEPGSDEA